MTTTYPDYSRYTLVKCLMDKIELERAIAYHYKTRSDFPSYLLGCLELVEARISELSALAIL